MGKRRTSHRPTGSRCAATGRRYVRLCVEFLEDRCFLSGSSIALFSPTGDNPVVIVVAPESNGSGVSWTPIAELSAVGFPVDSPPVVTFDGDHVTITQSQAANGSQDADSSSPASDARVSIGQATIEFTSPAGSTVPLVVDDSKPDSAALSSLANAIIPGEGPGNEGLGSDFNQPIINGDGIIIVNADTANPVQSISASNATMIQDGVVFQNTVPAAAATAPAAPASPPAAVQENLPASSETPSAPISIPRADQKSSNSSPDSATQNLTVDDLSGDTSPSTHAGNQFSTPPAAVSLPTTSASPSAQLASPATQWTTPTNRAATAEDPPGLLPHSERAPSKGMPSNNPAPGTKGSFSGPEMPPDAGIYATDGAVMGDASPPTASGAVTARRQPALLASFPLDIQTIDRAMENLLHEVDELGGGLANWLGVPRIPRAVIVAALLAVASSVGGHQLHQARRRRLARQERETEFLSRMFTSW